MLSALNSKSKFHTQDTVHADRRHQVNLEIMLGMNVITQLSAVSESHDDFTTHTYRLTPTFICRYVTSSLIDHIYVRTR